MVTVYHLLTTVPKPHKCFLRERKSSSLAVWCPRFKHKERRSKSVVWLSFIPTLRIALPFFPSPNPKTSSCLSFAISLNWKISNLSFSCWNQESASYDHLVWDWEIFLRVASKVLHWNWFKLQSRFIVKYHSTIILAMNRMNIYLYCKIGLSSGFSSIFDDKVRINSTSNIFLY